MKKYKRSSLVSYKSQDIAEILGPVESVYLPSVPEKRGTTGRNMKKRRD